MPVAVRDTNPRRCQDSAGGLTAGYRLSLPTSFMPTKFFCPRHRRGRIAYERGPMSYDRIEIAVAVSFGLTFCARLLVGDRRSDS
jgi:hypothetical protein